MTGEEINRIEGLASKATPTPPGHPLRGEYVLWISDERSEHVEGGRYVASGTVHDAAFLAAARDVLSLCAAAREARDSAAKGWRAAMVGLGEGDEALYTEAVAALRALGVSP